MEKRPFKLAITGPESSGKSTLSLVLTRHFEALLVPEFARTYLKNAQYNEQDILYMAEQQIKMEQEAFKSGAQIIICDTDIINFKIWLEYYAYEVPAFIENYLQQRTYTYTLLLYPNTKWIADKLRDKPHERLQLYSAFEKYLIEYRYPYSIIDKLEEDRNRQAIDLVTGLL